MAAERNSFYLWPDPAYNWLQFEGYMGNVGLGIFDLIASYYLALVI